MNNQAHEKERRVTHISLEKEGKLFIVLVSDFLYFSSPMKPKSSHRYACYRPLFRPTAAQNVAPAEERASSFREADLTATLANHTLGINTHRHRHAPFISVLKSLNDSTWNYPRISNNYDVFIFAPAYTHTHLHYNTKSYFNP